MLDIEAISRRFGEHADAVEGALRKHSETIGRQDGTLKEVGARIFDLEQKMARRGGSGFDSDTRTKTWGQQFAEADEVRAFAGETTRPGRVRLEVKAITSASNSAGSLAPPSRDTLVEMPKRRMVVRDLIPVVGVESGSVEYPKQTVRQNAAAPVAEGALKPESTYGFEIVTTPIRTLAHWTIASRQILDDARQLAGIIDTELRNGLELLEEGEILLGDGTGQHPHGLIPQATPFAAPITIAGATMLDTLALGMLQSSLADFPPDGIVLHPSDWMRMRLLKSSDGSYLLGDPASNVAPQLFGLPVVTTTEMDVDTWLLGNFTAAATLYDRWQIRVEASPEDSDNFRRNLVTILAEERIGLAVKQPAALTVGDFGNVA